MMFFVRNIMAVALLFGGLTAAQAQEDKPYLLSEFNISADAIDSSLLLADSRAPSRAGSTVPNIPDSAFKKPVFTQNNLHMYLGLASLGFGALTAITAPDDPDPDLLNSVHYKAAKASWQLGAAAIGTGLYSHWDDFHVEDGLFDRDNLHVILGTLGVVGYYLAVKGAVDQYNNNGYPSSDHASKGIFGGAAMLTAIVITW
ncbi:MAG: hypothetical protein R8M14_08500 [Ghiorsea sp.]